MEEKEFQLMLDIANEKMELTENRFRSISDTMKRVRDSGKLDDYDKTQVSLLCNKFSLAIEKLNGKTEYEVAMEEMSGGMMTLIAAAIGAILAMLAKMFGFFGSPKEGTAPTKANIEALKSSSKSVVEIIKNMKQKMIDLNNKLLNVSVENATLTPDVRSKIEQIKEKKNLLWICADMGYGEWDYPKFTIVKKADTSEEINKKNIEISTIFSTVIREIINPSEKIFSDAADYLKNNNGTALAELMNTVKETSIKVEEFTNITNEFKELLGKRKVEKFKVDQDNLWASITTGNQLYIEDNVSYENVIEFINFLDSSELRAEKLKVLERALTTDEVKSLSGAKELNEYINHFNRYQINYLVYNQMILDDLNIGFVNLKLHLELVSKIIEATSDIKSQLLKSNVTTAKDIDVIIASMALMFNNIIDIFITLTKQHVPKFEKNKSSDFFITCGKISKIKKFSVTQ